MGQLPWLGCGALDGPPAWPLYQKFKELQHANQCVSMTKAQKICCSTVFGTPAGVILS